MSNEKSDPFDHWVSAAIGLFMLMIVVGSFGPPMIKDLRKAFAEPVAGCAEVKP